MNKNSMYFVGLDLGDKYSYIAILDKEGELIEETRLPTTKTSFHQRFSMLSPCRVAMEVGTHSRWASHLLTGLGHDVLVANARKLRAIYHNPRKDDRADAETLARLARLDPELLSPIHHRSPQAQADLDVLRSRDAIVRSRTLLVNHTRSIVKSSGARLPSCSANCFASKAAPAVPETLRPALSPILETIASLTQQIREYDIQVEQLCQDQYPETKLLRKVSGVGPITALAYVLTLEDPKRFLTSSQCPSGRAAMSDPQSDWSPDGINPAIGIPSCAHLYLRCKCRCHQDWRCIPASPARLVRPIHPRSLRAGL